MDLHSIRYRDNEIQTPLIRSAVKFCLLYLVLPYCLMFRLVAGRLPKRAEIEFNGHKL